ncbi:unnamed protein product [Lymnaea stagnalis]|uniref:Uncharacterized protein n=1 Tax=Lymnaea stagnalis TaxID=6523 RepID=A0AAV2H1M9_LYMST
MTFSNCEHTPKEVGSLSSTQSLTSSCKGKAPIVRIESFDFESPVKLSKTILKPASAPQISKPALKYSQQCTDDVNNDDAFCSNDSSVMVVTNSWPLGKDEEKQQRNLRNIDIENKEGRHTQVSDSSKNVKAMNGLTPGFTSPVIANHRVSPFVDVPEQFCVEGDDDEDIYQYSPLNQETFPFMDSVHCDSSCNVEVETLPHKNRAKFGCSEKKGGKLGNSQEATEKIRHEMIPLLSNTENAVNCGFAAGCEDDEQV